MVVSVAGLSRGGDGKHRRKHRCDEDLFHVCAFLFVFEMGSCSPVSFPLQRLLLYMKASFRSRGKLNKFFPLFSLKFQ
jgi:hypothetical protein